MNIINRECFLSNSVRIFTDFADSRARKVWRHQRSNQKPEVEGRHTIQWQKEKKQKDKQTTQKTKYRATRTQLQTGGGLVCFPLQTGGGLVCFPLQTGGGLVCSGKNQYILQEFYVFIRLHLHQLFTFLNITILRVNDKLKPAHAEK